jgi:hypothetical protein
MGVTGESVKTQVKGKVQILLETLATGKEYTVDELSTISGASVGTVKMQLAYLLPKSGKIVTKNVVEGVTKYSVK